MGGLKMGAKVMGKGRLEAFSDAVIAIILTIMVLELKVPHGVAWTALQPLLPVFLSYVLSFLFIGIYWNNHHHLLHTAKQVDGRILWANMHLMFWLSLIPFVTGWMGENHFAPLPVALYGVVLLCCALAYTLLVMALLARHGRDSLLARALRNDFKGKASLGAYAVAIPAAFLSPWISCGIYVLFALWWLVPDRRIERVLVESES
jgi:uncharacterized membrane protein